MQLLFTFLFAIIPCKIFFTKFRTNYKVGLRCATVITWIGLSFLIFVSTEILNFLHAVKPFNVQLFWNCLLIISGSVLVYTLNTCNVYLELPSVERRDWLLIAGAAILILLPSLCVAFLYPPNNFDSMTYHLPRVEHWIQNGNIDLYPTVNQRQNLHQPFASYIVLHLRLLTGSDYLSNIVQYVSMLATLIVVTMLIHGLRYSYRWQITAALLTLSLPTGIFESVTTQTDYVASFFTASAVYFGLRLKERATIFHACLCGITIGLSLLTKIHTVLFITPFYLWCFYTLFNRNRTTALRLAFVILLLITIINSPFYLRVYRATDRLLGDDGLIKAMKNQEITLRYTLSNMLRNIGMNLGTPVERINTRVQESIERIHQTGLQMSASALQNSFGGRQFEIRWRQNEDYMGNFVYAFLLSMAIGYIGYEALRVLLRSTLPSYDREIVLYLICTIIGFVSYSALFKWQEWGNRLLLPWYVLSVIPVTCFLRDIQNRRDVFSVAVRWMSLGVALLFLAWLSKKVVVLISVASGSWFLFKRYRGLRTCDSFNVTLAVCLLATSALFIFRDSNRPLLTKDLFSISRAEKIYWLGSRAYERTIPALRQISQIIRENRVSNVGLDIEQDSWEYPIWREVIWHNKAVRLQHLNFAPARYQTNGAESVLYGAVLGNKKLHIPGASVYELPALDYYRGTWYLTLPPKPLSRSEIQASQYFNER